MTAPTMTTILPRPARRRIVFFLTPLIDVIFLLLVFFMLSSQIAPYSLIPLGRVQDGGGSGTQAPAAARPLVVRIAHGEVEFDGRAIPMPALRQAIETAGNGSYLLIPSDTANVQDIVSVLEVLKDASAGDVVLLNGQGEGR